MKHPSPFLLCLAIVVALGIGGCGGGPVRRINPPVATIQHLDTSGSTWSLTLRIENFSTVPMRFERIDVAIDMAGVAAGEVGTALNLDVPWMSAEVVEATIDPSAQARSAVAAVKPTGGRLSYTLRGEIVSAEPSGRYPFESSSWLNPVPGRPDEYR